MQHHAHGEDERRLLSRHLVGIKHGSTPDALNYTAASKRTSQERAHPTRFEEYVAALESMSSLVDEEGRLLDLGEESVSVSAFKKNETKKEIEKCQI